MKTYNEILSDVTKTATKIPQSDYLTEGKYRIFDQGKDYSGGFFNNNDGLVSDYPYIIFGDHTRVIKYVNEPCYIGADGVKLLKVINKNFDSRYIYYNILAKPIESQGYARHFKFLKEIQFTEKTLSEQRKIATELDTIQSAIDNKKQQLALLDEAVKSRFIEMFGDPVINPKGWEVKKINDVAPAKSYNGNFNYPVWLLNLDMIEAQTGTIIDYKIVDKEEIGTSTIGFDENNVLYSKLRPYLNKVVIPNKKGICTTELIPLKPDTNYLNRVFLANLLRSKSFVDFINEKVAGAKMPRVSMDEFRNFECIIPPIELQNDFAVFVQQIDKSKFVVKQQLADLQELLDSKMQEYFG